MSADYLDAPPPGGLAGLRALLPGRKGRYAVEWACAGHGPDPDRFARQGVALSPAETGRLLAWHREGLRTTVHQEISARDGTIRLVLALPDGEKVETVAMPVGAVCVSTQVGCAVGCRFCASGMFGLRRNLQTDEIVEQVVHARRRMRIDRVVYMGMGEPTHNLPAVLAAVAAIKQDAGIGPRRQTLSTVGSSRAFAALEGAEVRPCLAWSLHSADPAVRRELLQRAGNDPLPELACAAGAYADASGTPAQIEYVVLHGINDRDADLDALCALLTGLRGYVNFIVLNPVAGSPYASPPRARIVELVRAVKQRGILATIRDSAGVEAEAACGQLRRQLAGDLLPAAQP